MVEPTEPSPEQSVLTFEEFSRRDRSNYPRFGNFFKYFLDDPDSFYRSQPCCIRFEQEHPELASALCDKIRNQRVKTGSTSDSLRPYDRDLYEAYKIMRSYGVSDRDLFA